VKTRKRTFFAGSSTLEFESELPLECPHCGAYGVPDIVTSTHVVYGLSVYHMLILEHNCCDKISQAIYRVKDESGELLSLLPQIIKRGDFPDSIKKISPHFIELYNQCYEAEQRGFLELAGSGYRNALEVLIKDYAISVLHEPEKEVISCSLSKAIQKYLSEVKLSQSADVVRILGNDHTHYERKYDDIDFQILKKYLKIFVDSIDCEYLIRNPIVKTNPNLPQE
jgi:hypothetical protein